MGDNANKFSAWLLDAGRDDDVALLSRAGAQRYKELRARVLRVAALVRSIVGEGSIVPIVGPSSVEWVASYLGVLHAGAIPALVPPPTSTNLRAIFKEVNAQLAFVDAQYADAASGLSIHALGAGADGEPAPVARPADAMTALLYTSGSTGRPKGVMLSIANFVANAEAILDAVPLERTDRAFATLPFFYCYGLSVLHTHLRVGASVHVCDASLPEAIVDELVESNATGFPTVPSLLNALAMRSTLATRAPQSLRYLMVSGGRLPDAAVEQLARSMPNRPLHVRYGVTELTAAASFLSPDRLPSKIGSIGSVRSGLTVETDGRSVVGTEEIGEIVVRGTSVAKGYFGDDALTRERFRDGAFFTGDLARVDSDGFVYIVGRRTDFIKSIGHRISPGEIEEVLSRAPGVNEAGVCGTPHALRGEAIAAAVVLAPGSDATPASLTAYCSRELPAYKVPIKIVIVDALPKTATGKLDRAQLATLLSGR